jgi:flagellin
MSLVLNTNISSLVAQNNLTTSGNQLATSLQQLSSGLRINTAADDAAGFAIVQGFTSQINGINQAARNANDGVSLAQTGSGALTEIVNDLQTLRDLAVQSLNATNSASDRADLDTQFQQVKADINSVASQTQFNGVNLLDGSFQGATFQVGANAGQSITVSSIASANSNAIGNYYNSTLSVAGTLKTAGGSTLTTTAGTAGVYNSTTLAGATGLNTAVNGSSVKLSITVDGGSAVTTGAIALTGTQATDLKSEVSAINQAIGSNNGIVATVNAAGTGITLSSAVTNGAGRQVNFSVASATDAGGNTVTAGAGTLAALGIDSSDIIGSYTTAGTGGSNFIATGAAASGDTLTNASNGTVAVTIGSNTYTTAALSGLTGTAATDAGTIATALNAVTGFSGAGFTASVVGGALTITGGTTAFTVTSAAYSPGSADTGTPTINLGFNSTAATQATAGTPGTVTGSSAVQFASGLDVKSVDASNKTLISIDQALQQLASTGAQLGAFQNRFSAAVSGLSADSTNLTSARSQIQDTDFAQATSAFSKAQILQQASTAIVAQANTIPQNILTLLQKLP